MAEKHLKGWGTCLDCGYEGLLNYALLSGESYEDPEAGGVVMRLQCPACERIDHTLVTMDYFREMVIEQ